MLTGLTISDYQSHRRTRLQLGQFNVITGPSDVGKSSIIRAVQLVVGNASGTGYIRRGARSCAVVLTSDDEGGPRWAVGIERTAKGGGRYRVRVADGEPEEFTKLGGKVPAEAARLLRLSELNFSGQTAGPFLLGATGTEIARVLGDLTNVSMLFRAAQEAGRVRKGADRDIKNAETRLEQLQKRAGEFAALEGQLAAIEQAEQAAARAGELDGQLFRLGGLIHRAETAVAGLEQAKQAATACAPPDLTRLEAGLAKYTRLRELIAAHDAAEVGVEQWSGEATVAQQREKTAHQALHTAQESIGLCPLCGRGADAA